MDQFKKYNAAMLQSYSVRTASELSAYMLKRLKPGMLVLDVGCGPGTITADLVRHVLPGGSVTGLDANADAVAAAQEHGRSRHEEENLRFVVGDVLHLPFADGTFDVVHAHQVLVHIPSGEGTPGPVRALREMRRVCKPGGIVCSRDAEWSSLVVYPAIPGLRESLEMMEKLAWHRGTMLAGGRGREFARRAGFPRENIWASAEAVTYTNPEGRQWWGENMARRLEVSESRGKGVELGLVSEQEYAAMVAAWRAWAQHEDGFYSMTDGEIICTKEE
ncbi:methyltransferase-UbiE family protein [Biscogniauxia mediterranea]|nr:methyltransferase-UbiE family protein [Biscogniauxia mediterranea]